MASSEFQSQSGNLRSGNRPGESLGRGDAPSQPQRRNDESWVEIASQPSSSSLSSIGDEIVTTGLRVGVGRASYPPQQPIRRRRLLQLQQRQQQQQQASMPQSYFVSHAAAQGGMSSQEEYDETESEEDRLMTSSTENVPAAPTPGLAGQPTVMGPAVDYDTDSDDDENATALGRPSNSPTFRPQPNAFSHPPSQLPHRSHSTNSSVPFHPPYGRPSMAQRSQTRVHRNGPSFMSPHTREDNDEALRASLTTLLSCAAAARGLHKKDDTTTGPSGTRNGIRPSTQPMGLQLVQESELMDETPGAGPTLTVPPERKLQSRTASNSSSPSGPISTSSRGDAAGEKSKRSASATQTKSARASKKKKTAVAVDEEPPAFISPTLLTWVVGAGVVVLVSVVGFGAGYVIGREVGRQEGAMGLNSISTGANASSSCGSELVRSGSGGTLRRFRWGGGIGSSVAA